MKIIKENKFNNIFPMKIKCKLVKYEYGFGYGSENDFCGSELEVDMEDIVKHPWYKYPDYEGVDYGVQCPVCGQFIVIDKRILPEQILRNAKEI